MTELSNFNDKNMNKTKINQGNLAVSFEPGRSLRRRHLFDLCFRELQDMSNPRNPQASRMVPLMLIFKNMLWSSTIIPRIVLRGGGPNLQYLIGITS